MVQGSWHPFPLFRACRLFKNEEPTIASDSGLSYSVGYPVKSILELLRPDAGVLPLGKVGGTHEVPVALACRTPTLVDGPHHEALASAHVAGSKNTPHAGSKSPVLRLHVGAFVPVD